MLKNIWSKTKKLIPFLLMGAFVSGFVFARPASSTGPEFNIFPNDPKTLRVANENQGTDWLAEISASENDTVAFLVYYHNGIENTVAQNTRIRVDLPTGPAQTFQANSFLWADNTNTTVTDSAKISTNQNLKLEYVAGSTQIFRDRSQTGVALPDGITSVNGINIGNIQGCWEYAGYVRFEAKLTAEPTPPTPEGQLAIEKKVANSTRDEGSQNWQKEVTAGEGEFVAFNLFISNPGETALAEVNVKDILPDGLTYLNGSTNLFRDGVNSSLPDGITGAGVNIANLQTGTENGVYVVFQARVMISGDIILTNTGQATSGNLNVTDTARVIVAADHTAIPTIIKNVRNVSRSENLFLDNTTAIPNEIVEFKIEVKNIGDLDITQLNLIDYLPAGLTFLGNQNNFVDIVNGITKLSWNFDRIAPNETKTVVFQAKVGEFSPGNYTLTNIAEVHTACCDVIRDTAFVYVRVARPSLPNYTITKEVLNITKGDGIWSTNNQILAGDILQYRIIFANTGNITQIVKITDNLPGVVNYLNKTGTVKINGQATNFSTGLFSTRGLNFELKPGDKGTINFRVASMKNLVCASNFQNDAFLINPQNTLKASVLTRVKCQPQPEIKKPETLPATGLGLILPFSLLFGAANFAWFKRLSRKYKS